MQDTLKEKLKSWIEPYCIENNLFLVDITISGTKYGVFVDTMTNITIQECSRLNKFLQAKLDEEPGIPEIYTLDVSSPGMSNSLIVPQQFQKRLEKNLIITKLDGSGFEAKLIEIEGEQLTFEEIIPKNKKTKEEEKTIIHKINRNEIKKALIPIKF